MGTRRSPRNQEILWRALGGAKPAPVQVSHEAKIAGIERALADPFLSPRTKRMFARDIIREKHREAVRVALGGRS